jgi:hypothetical protein
MATFMFLILDADVPEKQAAKRGSGIEAMSKYAGELAQAGKMKGGAPLVPAKQARTLGRDRKGKLKVVDGPFTESKEIVSGYFLIEAKDRREAVSLARKCPHLAIGRIEVREVMEI